MTLPIRASFVVLLASVAILGTALASQYWGGLGPCVLCLYQRYPYGVVIGLMVIAVVIGQNRPGPVIALLGMASLAFLVGAGIGFFHVGVEQHWWAGTPECGATETARTIEALRAQILGRAPVRCDEVAWSLFGLSMAAYNVLASAALACFSGYAARRIWLEQTK